MFWESSGVVGFDLGPLLEGQMRTAKLKSAYNSLIIGPRGFGSLSLRWIQFASVLRCARSSYILFRWSFESKIGDIWVILGDFRRYLGDFPYRPMEIPNFRNNLLFYVLCNGKRAVSP